MHFEQLKRREFIALLSGAAAWPLAAHAQQPAMPVIGFLHPGSAEANASLVAAFRKGLNEAGYAEGRNVAIDFRWAHGDRSRLAELAADLVHRRVAVIATPIGTEAALVAKAATATIPIVFAVGTDPVQAGLVAAMNRPGGNVTGIANLTVELAAKRLGLLHELLPAATRFGVLVNPNNPVAAESTIKDVRSGAAAIGRQIEVLTASTNRGIDMAFASFRGKRADALMIGADPLFIDRRVQFATLAARHALPAIYTSREFAEAGGLMSYGASNADRYRQVGIYTGRILNGERPADLPVARVTKFEFVINLQTGKALDLEIPPMLLARADEVIE
jgi:putative ABC transport system substrate-binding protein